MNILKKITRKNITLNKKRNVVTIIGILLSVALITAVSTLVMSARTSLIKYEKKEHGDFHVLFKSVAKEDYKYIENNRCIEKYYYSRKVGYALLPESKNNYKPYAYVIAFNDVGINSMKDNLLEGRLPKNNNEIVIPSSLKSNGRVTHNIGDKLTLDIGKRMSEGYELSQDVSYTFNEETFVSDNNPKTYTIVGIIERPNNKVEPYSAPGYTFITLDNTKVDKMDVFVRFNKDGLKNPSQIIGSILGINPQTVSYYLGEYRADDMSIKEEIIEDISNSKYQIDTNTYLMDIESLSLNDATLRALYTMGAIALVIIIVSSVYCIKNAFNISITEKTKQFGILSSIGATKRQIKNSVLEEGKILGLIGIPLGIILGLLASYILLLITNTLSKNFLNLNLEFEISIVAIIVSILLSIITIYLSSIKAARRASKLSPLVAIRGNNDVKIKSKKIKSPKIIDKLFGIGGTISYKNLKRNKKKYRTAVVSIIICVATFIPLYYFVNTLFDIVSLAYSDYNYKIRIKPKDGGTSLDGFTDELLKLDGITNYSIEREISVISNDKKQFTKEYANDVGMNYCIGINNNETCYYTINLVSIGNESYKKYIKSLGLKYKDVKNKGIVINNANVTTYDEDKGMIKKKINKLSLNKNDILHANLTNPSYTPVEIEIAALTDKYPTINYNNQTNEIIVIVSDEVLIKYSTIERKDYDYNHEYSIYIDTKDAHKVQKEIEDYLKAVEYDFINIEEDAKSTSSLMLIIAIFLYGFITVVALIGITNIFNTITTSMELRRREFATLKSIGMTEKEFNKMISLENLFYGFKSLVIGIPIGILLSYGLNKAVTTGVFALEFAVPYVGIIIVSIVVLLVLFIIMKYSIKKTNNQNIIETIRNDNI